MFNMLMLVFGDMNLSKILIKFEGQNVILTNRSRILCIELFSKDVKKSINPHFDLEIKGTRDAHKLRIEERIIIMSEAMNVL